MNDAGFDALVDHFIARIAAGLTQGALAEQLGLKRQQVQRYEASEYATASLATIRQIAQTIESAMSAG